MINNIFVNDSKILSFEKTGRNNYAILDNGLKIGSSTLNKINIMCSKCNKLKNIGYRCSLLNKKYICQSCNNIGNKNPFFGKTCSEYTKQQISKANKNNQYWVGKNHSEKTKEKISKAVSIAISGNKNPFFGKTHSIKSRLQLSKSLKNWAKNNKEHFRKMGINSCIKQSKCKKTLPEKLVEKFLINNNINYVYSKRINFYQFDFFLLDFNTIIEVHGDYWHANPKIYGKNKKPLNETQIMKTKTDIKKHKLLKELNYSLVILWETDIKSGKFEKLLLKYKGNNYVDEI